MVGEGGGGQAGRGVSVSPSDSDTFEPEGVQAARRSESAERSRVLRPPESVSTRVPPQLVGRYRGGRLFICLCVCLFVCTRSVQAVATKCCNLVKTPQCVAQLRAAFIGGCCGRESFATVARKAANATAYHRLKQASPPLRIRPLASTPLPSPLLPSPPRMQHGQCSKQHATAVLSHVATGESVTRPRLDVSTGTAAL